MGEAKEYKNYFEFADGSCWFIETSGTKYETGSGFVNQSRDSIYKWKSKTCTPETVYAEAEKAANAKAKKALPQTPEFWKTAILLSARVNIFSHMPEEQKTEDICLAAVQRKGNLKFVPPSLQTYSVCLEAVRNGSELKDVPVPLRTAELCLEAIQKDGSALKDVPEHLRTAELCLTAVRNGSGLSSAIPQSVLTKELCLEAMQKYIMPDWEIVFDRLPKHLRIREMYIPAVRTTPGAIEFVPREFVTKDFVLDVIVECPKSVFNYSIDAKLIDPKEKFEEFGSSRLYEKWGVFVLKEMPESLKTKDLYLAAAKKNGHVLGVIPLEMRTRDICLAAVQNDGHALEQVPENLRDEAMCLAAAQAPSVFQSGPWIPVYSDYTPPRSLTKAVFDALAAARHRIPPKVFERIPKSELTQTLCLDYLRSHGDAALPDIPAELKTAEFWLAAAQVLLRGYSRDFLSYVPDEFKTYELCLAAVKRNPETYGDQVPVEYRTRELIYASLEEELPFWRGADYIPPELQTPELWLYAVQRDGYKLSRVPKESRTVEVCVAALNNRRYRLDDNPPGKDIMSHIPIAIRQEVCARFLSGNPVQARIPSGTLTVEALKAQGDNAYSAGDFSGAIAAYTTAIREAPGGSKDKRLFNNRGNAYRQLKDYDNALSDYLEAQRLLPTVVGYCNLGILYSDLGDYAKARENYLQALKLDPSFEPAAAALAALDNQNDDTEDEEEEDGGEKMERIMYDPDDFYHQAEEITGIDFPDGITVIDGDFNENEITELVFPDSVTRIAATFSYNPIEQIRFPPRLAFIGAEAFLENQLSEIDIPDSVAEIEAGAFCNNQLTYAAIPPKLQYIAENLFADNQLDTVEFPANGVLEQIDGGAFFNNRLEEIALPDTIKWIGDGAFGGNPLTSITIGAGVQPFDSAPQFAENTFGDYGKSFIAAYDAKGKKAGTYIYNEESGAWSIDGDDTELEAVSVPEASNDGELDRQRVDTVGNEALKAFNAKDWVAAEKGFTALLEVPALTDKERFDAFFFRGIAYYYSKLYEKAISDLNESLRHSLSAYAYQFLGWTYYDLGDYAKAREILLQSIQLEPANENVKRTLSEIDKKIGPSKAETAAPAAPVPQAAPIAAPAVVPTAPAAGISCAKCGAPVPAGAKFCTSCGTKVKAADSKS